MNGVKQSVFCCKGKRLANYFLDQGCKLIRIDSDQERPGLLVFIFDRDEGLLRALETWKTDKETYLLGFPKV